MYYNLNKLSKEKMNKRIYLAGPISGLSYDESRFGWRNQIATLIDPSIDLYSPMRHKDHLAGETSLAASDIETHVISTNKGIIARDRMDCVQADALIVNFIGAQRVSIVSSYYPLKAIYQIMNTIDIATPIGPNMKKIHNRMQVMISPIIRLVPSLLRFHG